MSRESRVKLPIVNMTLDYPIVNFTANLIHQIGFCLWVLKKSSIPYVEDFAMPVYKL